MLKSTLTLTEPVDCIEPFPFSCSCTTESSLSDDNHTNSQINTRSIASGTYKYNEVDRLRTGNLFVHHLDLDSGEWVACGGGDGGGRMLDNNLGVLDAQFTGCMGDDNRLGGAWPMGTLAHSDGSLGLLLPHQNDHINTEKQWKYFNHVIQSDAIAMHCDWSRTPEESVAVAMSTGAVCRLQDARFPMVVGEHELECWCVEEDCGSGLGRVLWSGGDDGLIIGWDCGRGGVAFCVNSAHDAGVCSLLTSGDDEWRLLSGSYDGRLMVWDKRKLNHPIEDCNKVAPSNQNLIDPAIASRKKRYRATDEVFLGGGVWRLALYPHKSEKPLMAACMYTGFHTLKTANSNKEGGMNDHSSTMLIKDQHLELPGCLGYGCAWLDATSAVTCTFYNHQLQYWCDL